MIRYRYIRYLFLPVLACICGASAMSEEKPEPEPPPGPRVCEIGDLVWSDEFDEDGLPNTSKWRYDVGGHGWGNGESQYYTSGRSENARVENGSLIIEAHKESWSGSDYTSTRLLSRAEWTYGRFEARAILPSGRGTWPAIWMLPDLNQYGGWPRAGEIDIMEHVGFDPDRVHSTVHTDAYNHIHGTHQGASTIVSTARSAFNVYAVEWTPSEIRGYVNGTHYFTFANERLTNSQADDRHWPFDHPFHLIFNIAVGGSWGGQQGIDPNIWPQRLQVDYVRVYSCGDGSTNAAPVFNEGATARRSVAENTAAGRNIGAPVTATDSNGDRLTYSLEGTDESSFAIVSTSGQLQTKASLDYESKSSYAVTVRASDGTASTTIAVTIMVTDETETVPPPANTIADAPENLRAVAGNAEVTLRWDAPNNDGGADITGYAYRYKESGRDLTAYTDIPESGPGEANARSYTVTGLTNGLEYVFHVHAVNERGGGLPEEVTVTLPSRVSTESEELPTEVALWGNYPNPFNPETSIRFVLPRTGHVRLAVYDVVGRDVAVLVDGVRVQGTHTEIFEAQGLPTGMYVYVLSTPETVLTRKMLLVK